MSETVKEGMEGSKGNPIVLFALNVVLSVTFAYMLIYLSDLANITTFGWEQVATLALILIAITYVVTHR